MTDLFGSIESLSVAYATHQTKPSKVVDAHLQAIEKHNPHLGAYQTVFFEQAMQAAEAADNVGAARPSLECAAVKLRAELRKRWTTETSAATCIGCTLQTAQTARWSLFSLDHAFFFYISENRGPRGCGAHR